MDVDCTDDELMDLLAGKITIDDLRWRDREYARIKCKPRRQRQLAWLEYASKKRIWLQIEGGVEYDKDLRDLVKKGLLTFERYEYTGWAASRNGYRLSNSYLSLTVKGQEALARKRI